MAAAQMFGAENLGQGLFGVQLEVTAKLLEAEKKKLTQLQLFQSELEDGKNASIDGTKELQQQKSTYARLSAQHHRLTKEYEEAARGLLRRTSKHRKSTRSLPSLGFKQTVKARPTIFGTVVGDLQRTEDDREDNINQSDLSAFHGPRLSSVSSMNGRVTFDNGHLMSGSLDALIERLVPTPTYYPDRTFIFAFLLCCRLFIPPPNLLSRVSQASASRMKDLSIDNTKKLAFNLLQLLSEWAETFTNDFRDEVMMMHFKDITTYCGTLSAEHRKVVGDTTQSLFKKLASLDKYDEVLSRATAAVEDRKLTTSSHYKSVLEVCSSPTIMAQQLSLIELERLANIGPEEFVQTFIPRDEADFKSTLSYIKRTSSLEAYVEWFNRLGYLVATEICLGHNKKVRAKVIDYFIEVATDCYDRGNFNSAMAIIAGINMSPVARLKKTWSKVKNRKFDRLEREMNPASNFAAYRASFKAAHLRKSDKVVLMSGCYSFTSRHSNGYINFEKFWQLSKLITDFVSWKEATCKYERNRAVLNYLMTVPVFSEDNLAYVSYDREVPDTPFEKERHKSLKTTAKQADKR
ncbi:ras-GEF domain-containing family member 1B isoform X2 [Nematostella vectensis]|uniref:ras-GEF domain-containing family member 1B isoform X2 n=1 Tax=Nematostella vectensis TaxID=45351 RepID=UPI0020778977|nr:ras-GEF domain-containing family member 1B isoform X2 [Nematostella vectensis]